MAIERNDEIMTRADELGRNGESLGDTLMRALDGLDDHDDLSAAEQSQATQLQQAMLNDDDARERELRRDVEITGKEPESDSDTVFSG